MLRIFCLAVLTIVALPTSATDRSRDGAVVAQQQPQQQTPKRDCEQKQDEGVSA